MSDNTVLVLLPTYNGEKYVQTLILSILASKDVSVEILVRDDGSSDKTQSILRSINDTRLIIDESNVHLGVVKSFSRLLEISRSIDSKYIAFADQDDIWLPEKLVKAIDRLEKTEKSLYSSRRLLLKEKSHVQQIFPSKIPSNNIFSNIFENSHASCTMVFTASFRDMVLEKNILENAPTVDHTFIQYATLKQLNTFEEESFILYRIHKNNHIGVNNWFQLFRRITSFKVYNKQFLHLLTLDFAINELGYEESCELRKSLGSIRDRLDFLKNKKFRESPVSNFFVKTYIFLFGIK
jgi:glycosyltransferase involved in cell wall biosynthesis